MSRKNKFLLLSNIVVILFVAWLVFFRDNEIDMERERVEIARMNFPESGLSGVRCEDGESRPLAIMLASDVEARPLSGLSKADMIFEMPVTDSGTTRMMAVFQCEWPEEIGSVRSSRLDFIPLARGLNAIYAHWGGEKEALEQLNDKVIDNIDAMKYDGTIFYRKPKIKPPHNGFTGNELLKKAMGMLDYSISETLITYPHKEPKDFSSASPPVIYKDDFEVAWEYNSEKNSYPRSRGGKPEIDKNSSEQIEAKAVILLKTSWSPINKDYIRVKTIGSGEISVYQNGQEIKGLWEKKTAGSKLYFYDNQGQEIKFTPGQIWIEIIV